jgi:RecB family exonuclease
MGSHPLDNFEPLTDPFSVPRVAVTATLSARPLENAPRNSTDVAGRTLVGTLVHRLFERFGIALARATATDDVSISDVLARLLKDDEAVEAGDHEELFSHVREAYLALCAQPTVAETLDAGEVLFEVPFSVRPAASPIILRGSFDCLVRRPGGNITVLEIKTGKPAPEHDQQLSIYLTAARALFPGMTVDGSVVYARPPDQFT